MSNNFDCCNDKYMPKFDKNSTIKNEDMASQTMHDLPKFVQHCLNPSYTCTLPCLEHHNYCEKHIFQSPTKKYKQCAYVYKNHSKCTNPIERRSNRRGQPPYSAYCFQHSIRNQMLQAKAQTRRKMYTNETLLSGLTYHILNTDEKNFTSPPPVAAVTTTTTHANANNHLLDTVAVSDDCEEIDVVNLSDCGTITESYDLVRPMTGEHKVTPIFDHNLNNNSLDTHPGEVILNKENFNCHLLLHACDDDMSDFEEDPLKNAGHFTVEEILNTFMDKQLRLYDLYKEQLHVLNRHLQKNRRQYIEESQKEAEMNLISLEEQSKTSHKDYFAYQKLKSLRNIRMEPGPERLLNFKRKEKLKQQLQLNRTVAIPVNCSHIDDDGIKCIHPCLPMLNLCQKHILLDKEQLLFEACPSKKNKCTESFVKLSNKDKVCFIHSSPPISKDYVDGNDSKIPKQFEDNNDKAEELKCDLTLMDNIDAFIYF